jgi:diguanylate cyclase (GGDEF)-like protein
MLDVDDFKSYNDKNGHLAGDEVLRTISRILRKSVRSHDLVARYGGEEFAIIMPALACDQAIETAERLRVAIEGYAWPLAPVTASLGVSTLTAEMADGRDLLQAADDALYASKAAGRNRATHSARLASTDS